MLYQSYTLDLMLPHLLLPDMDGNNKKLNHKKLNALLMESRVERARKAQPNQFSVRPRELQPWEKMTPEQKERFATLKRGDVVGIYTDWQEEDKYEGCALLLEMRRWYGSFSIGTKKFVGEMWKVQFPDGFTTYRTIRVDFYVLPV